MYEVMFWNKANEALGIGYKSFWDSETLDDAWNTANALLPGMAKRGAVCMTMSDGHHIDQYGIIIIDD